ncbi:MAG: tetratricopeptide repeat protein [Akkermansiaceae bacterium]|nr:tetratricopeptide repeat protein [Akkermansiaceae bacterium]MCP5548714.1 tetratricopeptide repeat protein [Akkermansiaceae bacterium]
MKTITRYLMLPVLCHGLLCGSAEAKKKNDEESESSSRDKREQRQQTGPSKVKPSGGGGGQNRKANQGGSQKVKPSKQERRAEKKQKSSTEPQRKSQSQKDARKAAKKEAKKEARKQSGSSPSTGKKSDKSGSPKKNKEDKKAILPRKDSGGGKSDSKGSGGKSSNKGSGKETGKPKGGDSKSKDGKPDRMDLPGKRPDAGGKTAGGGKKADSKRDSKSDGDKSAAKRDDSKKSAKTDSSKKKSKRMELPGKRPTARASQSANQTRKEVDRLADRRKRSSNAKNRVEQSRKRGVVRPGQNTKKVRRVEIRERDRNNWWAGGNRTRNVHNNVQVNNVTYINNNFRRNVNWTTDRRRWGYNPWWYRSRVRPWYSSCWNYGWRPSYYHRHYYYHDHGYRPPGYARVNVTAAVGWGLLGWSLGTMVYDYGYHRYYNPYPVQTVVIREGRNIDYREPINRVAVETAPDGEDAVAEITEQSESHIQDSQDAFREGNYLVALEQADKAIAVSPGDGALHEYRALILFALGKYGDAAGVLNPVLASGPGWTWSTMVALYPSQEVYTDQLQKLEAYSEASPDAADAHFLLGYHYMVCGHLDLATPQFERAVELMPADSVSKQLASLTRESDEDAEDSDTVPLEQPADEEEMPEPVPVPLEKLTGVWTTEAEGGGTITLTFREDGSFTWAFTRDGDTKEFKGEYSSNDDGLLVLDAEESQMVASVDIPETSEMNFVLVGGPPDDPGLDFTKG